MAVDFFLNLLLGDVVIVRHDGVWLGRVLVCGYVERIRLFLRFKKNLESRMRLVGWKAEIEGYSGIYTYADALKEGATPLRHMFRVEKVGAGMQLECPASSSADRNREQVNKVRHAL